MSFDNVVPSMRTSVWETLKYSEIFLGQDDCFIPFLLAHPSSRSKHFCSYGSDFGFESLKKKKSSHGRISRKPLLL